jgi:CRP-like cAMP-binding protein
MPSEAEKVSRGDRLLALRACPGFDTLGAPELWRVAAMLRPRSFRVGEEIMPSGMPLSSMELMVKGCCDLIAPTGERRELRPPDVVGSLAELLDEVKAPRVLVRERTVTLGFDRAELEDLLEDDFGVFLGLLRGLALHAMRRDSASNGSGASPSAAPQSQKDPAADLVDLILLLRKQPYFDRAELGALAALAQQADRLVFAGGSSLVSTGSATERFLILTAGRAVVETRGRSARIGSGDQLAIPEALAGVPVGITAIAEGTVSALGCSASTLVDLVEDYPSLGLGLLHTLAHQARG